VVTADDIPQNLSSWDSLGWTKPVPTFLKSVPKVLECDCFNQKPVYPRAYLWHEDNDVNWNICFGALIGEETGSFFSFSFCSK
jgi:hypothetical protein